MRPWEHLESHQHFRCVWSNRLVPYFYRIVQLVNNFIPWGVIVSCLFFYFYPSAGELKKKQKQKQKQRSSAFFGCLCLRALRVLGVFRSVCFLSKLVCFALASSRLSDGWAEVSCVLSCTTSLIGQITICCTSRPSTCRSSSSFIEVSVENFGWVRILVVCFLCKTNPYPRKIFAVEKKWPKCHF